MKKLNFDSQQKIRPNRIGNNYTYKNIDIYFNIRTIQNEVNKNCWIKIVSLSGEINWSK